MVKDPLEEWAEDFGASPASDSDLERLLDRVRQDVDVRQAINELLALRWISRQLLSRIEESEPGAQDQQLRLARFLIRGEGGLGSGRA